MRDNFTDSEFGNGAVRLREQQHYGMFRQRAGMLEKGMDFALDIESSIYDVVDDLVDQKLPIYISRKEHELKEILTDFIDGKVARSRIADMGIEMNSSGILNIVDRLLQKEQAREGLKKLSDSLVSSILNVPIKNLLHVASVTTIFDIYKVFAVEIKDFRSELTENIRDKQPTLVHEVGVLVKSIIEKVLLPLPVKQLTGSISREDVDKTVKNIIVAIGDSKIFANELEDYSKNIIKEIKGKELHELVDVTLVKQDSLVIFSKIVVDEEFKANLERGLQDVLAVLWSNINHIVTVGTKDFTLDIIVKSLLDSLENHLLDVINAVNIKQVTEREINNMEAKEIEDMFNSFAKPYFRKIEAYGWIGGGFGVVANVLEKVLNLIIK